MNQRRKNNYHIKKKFGEYELRVIPTIKNPIALLDKEKPISKVPVSKRPVSKIPVSKNKEKFIYQLNIK